MKKSHASVAKAISFGAISMLMFGALAVAGPGNTLLPVKVFRLYNAYQISRDDISLFTNPATLGPVIATKTFNESRSNQLGMWPGYWELTLHTTNGLLAKGMYASAPTIILNEAAQLMNQPSRQFPVRINRPGFATTVDNRGEYGMAITEQGIKVFLEEGGDMSVLTSLIRLVVNQTSRIVLEIRQPDPRVLVP